MGKEVSINYSGKKEEIKRKQNFQNYDGSDTSTGGTIEIKGGTFTLNDKVKEHPVALIGAGRGSLLVDKQEDSIFIENPKDMVAELHAQAETRKLWENYGTTWFDSLNPIKIEITGGTFDLYEQSGLSRMIGGSRSAIGLNNFLAEAEPPGGDETYISREVPKDKIAVLDPLDIHIGGKAQINSCGPYNAGIGSAGGAEVSGTDKLDSISLGCRILIDGEAQIDLTEGSSGQRVSTIGGGNVDGPVQITIGGKAQVTAKNDGFGAAIGGGVTSAGIDIAIQEDADVTAEYVGRGSAIGGGYTAKWKAIYTDNFEKCNALEGYGAKADKNTITISGGTINATSKRKNGNPAGPAIGFGKSVGGKITISGDAKVDARNLPNGAVIGTDMPGTVPEGVTENKVSIVIKGRPTIYAKKEILGGTGFGAAIGSGYNGFSHVAISGNPTIYANGGKYASAIGGNAGEKKSEVTLNLGKDAKLSLSSYNKDSSQSYYSHMPINTKVQARMDDSGEKKILDLRFDGAMNLPGDAVDNSPCIWSEEKVSSIPLQLVGENGLVNDEIPAIYKGTIYILG